MDQKKRDAVKAALAANPTLSNKAISRLAGVSDHLVAKVRRQSGSVQSQPFTCVACGAKYATPSEHAVCPNKPVASDGQV